MENKIERISHLIQRKTRRSTVASKTTMPLTATVVVHDDDVVSETSVVFKH